MNNIYHTDYHILIETKTTTWAIHGSTWYDNFPQYSDDDLKTMTDEDFEKHIDRYGGLKGFFEVD